VAGTNAFVWVLIGGWLVAGVAVVARACVEVARIRAGAEREVRHR